MDRSNLVSVKPFYKLMKPKQTLSTLLLSCAIAALISIHASLQTRTSQCLPNDVLWIWKGALTSSSITFKFGLGKNHSCHDKDFILYAFPQLEGDEKPHSTIATCHGVGNASELVKECIFDTLPHPNRFYTYKLTLVSTTTPIVVKQGTFQTPPIIGKPFNFRFVFSSCADEESNPNVFVDIKQQNPFFFLHMGDLHYHNIDTSNLTLFRQAYYSLFASPSGQAMLEMDLPFAYMWDDHDYGPDNSDKTALGRNQSVQAYREFVPHYPLYDKGPLSAIYQAFTIGRIRFILTDLRSERTPNLAPDVPSKSVLGVKQKQWFKEELLLAAQDSSIGLIIWCSTMPWNDDERKWGYYTYEQRELIEYIQANGVNRWKKLVIVSGDAHMLAVDDGQHTPGNIPLFHAAALGRPGSIKGGPYSHGVFDGSGQYGIMDVRDDGEQVCLYFQGVRTGTGVIIEYDTCHPERTPPNSTYYPPPIPMRQLGRAWKKARKQLLPIGIVVIGIVLMILGSLWRWISPLSIQKPSKKNA